MKSLQAKAWFFGKKLFREGKRLGKGEPRAPRGLRKGKLLTMPEGIVEQPAGGGREPVLCHKLSVSSAAKTADGCHESTAAGLQVTL